MMQPIARYMILCNDWFLDPDNPRRVHIVGLISSLRPADDPPYPFVLPEICVFLALTDCRGSGSCRIVCTHDATGRKIFETRQRQITFGPDPIEILGVPFRIRDCPFPHAGLCTVQFWYEGQLVEERPLRLR